MKKSYIWPFANRISHLLMILFFTVAYILGDFKDLLSYHVAFGLALGVLFAFRTVWGFIGPKYSRFKDFNFNLYDLKDYLLSVFSKTKEYVGHNPASSYAIVAMIVVAFLSIITGLLAYGIEENHGILSFLHSTYFKKMEIFKEFHEFFSNLFLAIVGVHMAGALIDKFIKKSDAVDSMVSGYKKLTQSVHVKVNIFQNFYVLAWIVLSVFSLYYLIFTKDNIFIANANIKQNYALIHKDFANECGSCHITYPPFLLPKKSWTLMMSGLENHFGDDASIDKATNHSILAFLKQNSAENSTHQAALGILKSLKDDNGTIAITKTPFWKKRHKKVSKDLFASKEVKSRANCKACHTDIQNGLIENDLINLPKGV